MYVDLKMGGTPQTALINSGAEVSLITWDVVEQIEQKQAVEWTQGTLQGSTPGEQDILGAVEIDIEIGKVQKKVQFGVVEDFPFPVLLAMNIIRGGLHADMNYV